ncbi:MAG: OmpA family protein [Myxococcota bacterium]
MRTMTKAMVLPLIAGALLTACATSQPPEELRQARAEYRQALEGPEARIAADELRRAKVALEEAEDAWRDGDEEVSSNRAALALRRINIAQARTQMLRRRGEATAEADVERWFREDMARRLDEPAGREAAEAGDRGVQAERGLRSPRGRLEMVANVEDEPRGVRVTLEADALFQPEEAELMAGSHVRLDRVVDLADELTWSEIEVVGHTDSRGAETFNRELSTRRAEAVRTYLVTHGLPGERITAEGRGESEPLESNATAEGREANQRIEILIETAKTGGPRGMRTPTAPPPESVPPGEDRPEEPDREPQP